MPTSVSNTYRHNKTGNLYLLLGLAYSADDKRPLVCYKALYGTNKIWIRDHDEFFGTVIINGKEVDRFENVIL
jgi:hypothetical protein